MSRADAEAAGGGGLVTPEDSAITDRIEPTLMRKRAGAGSPPGERSSKKSKDSSQSSSRDNIRSPKKDNAEESEESIDEQEQPAINKETYQGFVDIESDPAYFSVILREMGVRGLAIREVFDIDEAYLQDFIPQPIHGLILLYHYREFGTSDQPEECPEDVWFANQLPAQDSCGTLAMINILMNSDSTAIDIGEHLSQFKDFTKDMTPYQRGEAFASFDFIKRIHNSFAKRMDILENDRLLSHKVSKARAAEKRQQQQEEDSDDAFHKSSSSKTKGKGTKSRPHHSSIRAASNASTSSADAYETTANHFIAFLPLGTQVWKLDGLDKQPTSMGSFAVSKGETWLSIALHTIQSLMVAAGDDTYSVMALTSSPLVSLRDRASRAWHTLRFVEARLDALDTEWRAFLPADAQPVPSAASLGIMHPPEPDAMPHDLCTALAAQDLATLVARRGALVEQLAALDVSIGAEMQQEAEEDAKAEQRRFDCGPVIKRWLEMLAENGYLEENLKRFMAGGGRGRK